MSHIAAFTAANAAYVNKGTPPPTTVPRNLAVVICMDARVDPAAALGLNSNAAIIRNAGGIFAEALRSLLVFQKLFPAVREVAVVHHTDCGMLRTSGAAVRAARPAGAEPADMDFHEFADVEESVRRDVAWLEAQVSAGTLFEGTKIVGMVYETESGKVRAVE